jgi:hypothetical protein
MRFSPPATTVVLIAGLQGMGCEPQAPSADDALRINGTACVAGVLPADFTGLTVGAPADRPVRVQSNALEAVEVEAAFGDDTNASFSLLRAPFPAPDATVVPLRIQLTAAGTVTGTLFITPVVGAPCELTLTATTP